MANAKVHTRRGNGGKGKRRAPRAEVKRAATKRRRAEGKKEARS